VSGQVVQVPPFVLVELEGSSEGVDDASAGSAAPF
jgi:hypothetical protein